MLPATAGTSVLMALFWLSLLALTVFSHTVHGQDKKLCLSDAEYLDEQELPVHQYYVCPQPGDPPDHIKCCDSDGGCCADVIVDSVLKVDVRIAMVISLTVIVACVVSGLTVIVCCFCSGCPMYDTCSGSWDQSTTPSAKKNGQALPWDYTSRGDYMPAADVHPESLNNGLGWDNDLYKNHQLPDDSKESQDSARAADHV